MPRDSVAAPSSATPATGLTEALNEAPLGMFHLRTVLTAGMGFFTDAYDLFIIGAAMTLISRTWHPSSAAVGLVGSTALIAAFVGAFIFGRLADVYGRKAVYGIEAAIMALAAVASAFSPNIVWLIAFRFILGVGIGGDYPVSAVIMSEYANRQDRGKLVTLVFSMQALGLVIGPVVALALLASGIPADLAWRLMLGLGALPAAAVIYFRRTMPESPRFLARVRGDARAAARSMERYTSGALRVEEVHEPVVRLAFWQFIANPRYLLMLLGTAGTWFVFDYAYYGNSISTPLILKDVAPGASPITAVAWTLIIFAVAAVPGYVMSFLKMDRIGHKRLQIIGFTVMGLAFLAIGVVPGLTHVVAPFLIVYGISYFFAEFGPNCTTFVLSAELYPVSVRTTGHGMSAGIAKFGAFIGVFLFPILNNTLGLSGTLTLTCALSLVGALLTLVLPEPTGKSLEELSEEVRFDAPAAGVGLAG